MSQKTRKPCTIDGCNRPKTRGSTMWCYWHKLERQSTTVQVQHAAARLAKADAPAGTRRDDGNGLLGADEQWCLDCQWIIPSWYMHNGKRCRACEKARIHGKAIEKNFGITAEQYNELLRIQDGRCAICRGVPRSKRLAVEHDHKTGEVRGLCCSRCNHELLGAAHDDIEILHRAIDYLVSPPGIQLGTYTPREALRVPEKPAPVGCTDPPPF